MANQFVDQLNQQLAEFTQKVSALVAFVTEKLKNFKNITIGEQVSYSSVGLGFVLILVSIVLFIV